VLDSSCTAYSANAFMTCLLMHRNKSPQMYGVVSNWELALENDMKMQVIPRGIKTVSLCLLFISDRRTSAFPAVVPPASGNLLCVLRTATDFSYENVLSPANQQTYRLKERQRQWEVHILHKLPPDICELFTTRNSLHIVILLHNL
jgi:hypothetical protein